MANLAEFRRRLVDDKYSDDPANRAAKKALADLPPSAAIDLLAGRSLGLLDNKVGAWRIDIERGAGFYFDACYSVTDFSSITTFPIDHVGAEKVVVSQKLLDGLPPDELLWR